jgi:peptide/nickel transport system substrate-binding protein
MADRARQTPQPARRGEGAVVGLLAEPLSLDPHRTDLVSAAVIANVCEELVLRQRAPGPKPAATTWATVDRRVWTFTLREGVRFHDGTPLDADTVIANLDDLRRQRAFPGRAQRIGPHVVEIALEQPNAALLATLSQPFFCIESTRRSAGPLPVGTGPFASRRLGRDWSGYPPISRTGAAPPASPSSCSGATPTRTLWSGLSLRAPRM